MPSSAQCQGVAELMMIPTQGLMSPGVGEPSSGRMISRRVKRCLQLILPPGTTGAPMTYMHEGKQYIVVAVSSRGSEPEWVALGVR